MEEINDTIPAFHINYLPGRYNEALLKKFEVTMEENKQVMKNSEFDLIRFMSSSFQINFYLTLEIAFHSTFHRSFSFHFFMYVKEVEISLSITFDLYYFFGQRRAYLVKATANRTAGDNSKFTFIG